MKCIADWWKKYLTDFFKIISNWKTIWRNFSHQRKKKDTFVMYIRILRANLTIIFSVIQLLTYYVHMHVCVKKWQKYLESTKIVLFFSKCNDFTQLRLGVYVQERTTGSYESNWEFQNRFFPQKVLTELVIYTTSVLL